MVAVGFEGNILVFGGDSEMRVMFKVSEEGDWFEYLSDDWRIPLELSSRGSFTVQEGKVLTAVKDYETECCLRVFDGKKWSTVC